MTYAIGVEPSRAPGKVTAHSSDGHTFTTSTPVPSNWLDHGADPAATIVAKRQIGYANNGPGKSAGITTALKSLRFNTAPQVAQKAGVTRAESSF